MELGTDLVFELRVILPRVNRSVAAVVKFTLPLNVVFDDIATGALSQEQ